MNLKLIKESKSDEKRIKNKNSFELWKNQISKQSLDQTISTYHKLQTQINNYDSNKQDNYYELLNKLDYIEEKLGIKSKFGRELH